MRQAVHSGTTDVLQSRSASNELGSHGPTLRRGRASKLQGLADLAKLLDIHCGTYVSEVLVHEARDMCTSGPGDTVSLDIKTLKPFKPPPLNALSQSQSQNPSKPRRLKPKPLKAKPPFGAPGTPLSRAEQPEVLTSLALSSLLRGLATGTLVSTAMEVRSSVSMHSSEEARRCSERRVRKPDLNPKPLP